MSGAKTDLDPQTDLEDEDEDIFSQMDENGIIGMDEVNEYYLQYPPRLEDGLEAVEEDGEMMGMHNEARLSGPAHPRDFVDDESFNISEFQDSDGASLSLSAEEDPSPNHLPDESDVLEEDGILLDQDSKSLWHHEQDQWSDKTDDEKDGGTLNLQNTVVSGEQEESEESYPDLQSDKQPEETIAGTLGDSWCRYIKAPRILDHGDDLSVQRIRDNTEKHADQSIGSINCSKTQGKDSSLSAQDCYYEDFEAMYSNNMDHYGDVLEVSSKAYTSEIRKEGEDNSSSTHPVLQFNQVLLSHLSVEDLASEADIEAETIPGSPSSDSVGESMGRLPTKGRTSAKGIPGPGCGNERRNDKIRQPEVSKAASNGHVKLTNLQKHPSTLSKPLISTDKNSWQTLSPQRRPVNHRGSTKPLSRKITSETAIYGRGQLNYPLPDFSKVEPRVKFPKDELAYRKPRRKAAAMCRNSNHPQLLLHSPADIVRQVLQSSSECPPITPTPPGVTVVEEFKCPQQATEMVYQLQEDYRRLLTKYAEAENTIDRLRIEAKVNLVADPPKPSHSSQGTSLSRASKVMTFAFSHPQKAEVGPPPDSHTQTGCSSVPESHDTLELPGTSTGTWTSGQSEPTAGEDLTWALAQQAKALQNQMDIFEEFLKSGRLASVAQQKTFQKLKEGQDALERGYLQAREEYRSLQQKDTGANKYSSGKFDPSREVEGNIFRLGMRLEDVKERIDHVPESNASTDLHSDEEASPNSWVIGRAAQQPPRPVAMVQAPEPALQTPAATEQNPEHESLVPSVTFQLGKVNVEVSSVSGESENEDTIPRILKRKKIQLEEDFDQLLDQYENLKDLPLSLGLDKVRQRPEYPQPLPNAFGQEMEKVEQMKEVWVRASHSDLDADSRKTPEPRQPMKMQTMFSSGFKDLPQPALDGAVVFPKVKSSRSHTKSPDSKGAHLTEKRGLSPGQSATCVDGIASPERAPCKTLLQSASIPLEDRIVSPETDSGFVGSESSRITPAVRTPEHHHPLSRSQSQREKLLNSRPRDATQAKQAVRCQEALQRGVSDYRSLISQNRQRRESVAQAGPSRTSSPQQWAGSIVSEFEQETVVSHTESEADGLGAYTRQKYQHSSLVSSPLTFHPKAQCSSSPLTICSATDELIQALQIEVSQVRHRLEKTLQKSQRDSEGNPPLTKARPRRHLIHQHSPRRKLPRDDEDEGEGQTHNKSSAGHNYSKSFPHFGSELEVSTESEASSSVPRPLASVSQINKKPSPHKIQRPRPVKGPYTGTDYSFFVPPSSGQGHGRVACPSCGGRPAEMADAPTRTATFLTSSLRSKTCPTCEGSGTYNERESKGKPERVAKEKKRSARRQKGGEERTVRMAEPPVTVGYVPPLYYVPHASKGYYSAPACAYASPIQSHFYHPVGYKGMESTPNLGGRRSKSRHHRPSSLDEIQYINGEEVMMVDLNSSLDQAIKAAKSMKWTTLKMAKSLTSDLRKAKAT